MASCVCKLLWLHYLLHDWQVFTTHLSTLACDNQFAIHIANNPVFHKQTKHINIACHLVRNHLQVGLFCLLHVSSEDQLADILTKPDSKASLRHIIPKLGMFNLHSLA